MRSSDQRVGFLKVQGWPQGLARWWHKPLTHQKRPRGTDQKGDLGLPPVTSRVAQAKDGEARAPESQTPRTPPGHLYLQSRPLTHHREALEGTTDQARRTGKTVRLTPTANKLTSCHTSLSLSLLTCQMGSNRIYLTATQGSASRCT